MALARAAYRPRDAERGVLHIVVRTHLETFLCEAARRAEGAGLPHGVLAHGFDRLRCDSCALERLVSFSCKGRGFCPSCGGRRMTERAALRPRPPVGAEPPSPMCSLQTTLRPLIPSVRCCRISSL